MELDDAQIEHLADSLVASHDKLVDRLISMRKTHRLSQESVAERMGVSQPTVAAFERYDANPTLSTIRRYALAVGASIEHQITDVCAEHASTRFEDVVDAGRATWPRQMTVLEWAWDSGPVVVKANVS